MGFGGIDAYAEADGQRGRHRREGLRLRRLRGRGAPADDRRVRPRYGFLGRALHDAHGAELRGRGRGRRQGLRRGRHRDFGGGGRGRGVRPGRHPQVHGTLAQQLLLLPGQGAQQPRGGDRRDNRHLDRDPRGGPAPADAALRRGAVLRRGRAVAGRGQSLRHRVPGPGVHCGELRRNPGDHGLGFHGRLDAHLQPRRQHHLLPARAGAQSGQSRDRLPESGLDRDPGQRARERGLHLQRGRPGRAHRGLGRQRQPARHALLDRGLDRHAPAELARQHLQIHASGRRALLRLRFPGVEHHLLPFRHRGEPRGDTHQLDRLGLHRDPAHAARPGAGLLPRRGLQHLRGTMVDERERERDPVSAGRFDEPHLAELAGRREFLDAAGHAGRLRAGGGVAAQGGYHLLRLRRGGEPRRGGDRLPAARLYGDPGTRTRHGGRPPLHRDELLVLHRGLGRQRQRPGDPVPALRHERDLAQRFPGQRGRLHRAGGGRGGRLLAPAPEYDLPALRTDPGAGRGRHDLRVPGLHIHLGARAGGPGLAVQRHSHGYRRRVVGQRQPDRTDDVHGRPVHGIRFYGLQRCAGVDESRRRHRRPVRPSDAQYDLLPQGARREPERPVVALDAAGLHLHLGPAAFAGRQHVSERGVLLDVLGLGRQREPPGLHALRIVDIDLAILHRQQRLLSVHDPGGRSHVHAHRTGLQHDLLRPGVGPQPRSGR